MRGGFTSIDVTSDFEPPVADSLDCPFLTSHGREDDSASSASLKYKGSLEISDKSSDISAGKHSSEMNGCWS